MYDAELLAVRSGFGKALEGKPQELQDKMIKGKLVKFLQEKAMDCQKVGFEESDLTIAEYMAESEKWFGKMRITRAERFGV